MRLHGRRRAHRGREWSARRHGRGGLFGSLGAGQAFVQRPSGSLHPQVPEVHHLRLSWEADQRDSEHRQQVSLHERGVRAPYL